MVQTSKGGNIEHGRTSKKERPEGVSGKLRHGCPQKIFVMAFLGGGRAGVRQLYP